MTEEDGRRVNATHDAPTSYEPTSYEPGQFVRHPGAPDWGVGQVQSVVGHRVTVNFADAGKVLVNTELIALDVLDAPY